MGETIPGMLMIPFVFPLVHDSWRGGLAAWGIPLILIALLIAVLAPKPNAAAAEGQR